MPYKRKRKYEKKTKTKKKTYRKRPRFSMSKGILSKTFRQNHRYVEQISLNPTTLLTGAVYSANGLYDPNISGVGHQPLMYDEMSALYNHYTVLAAKITVAFMVQGDTASTNQYICAIRTAANSTLGSDPILLLEQGDANWKFAGQGNGGDGIVTVRKQNNISAYLGQSVMQEDNNAGISGGIGVGANPAEQVYFHVMAGAFQGGTDPDSIRCVVTIDYDTVWHELKTKTLS